MSNAGAEQGCLIPRGRTNVVAVRKAIQTDRKHVEANGISPGRQARVAIANRGRKSHQLDDDLMPGETG